MGADAAAEEQFGPYAVYERLGVGGMATVHRALERGPDGFERMVALKRLLPHLAEDASFIKSFVREAKLASILDHINIVQIYELGRVGTEYFISMEYIDGHDVRRILRHARKVTGAPPIHVTVALLIQLCEALEYAHTKVDENGEQLRLVHRDVSPSNVIVTSAGHLKVIDFGIAKAESSQLRTQTGRVKGKLAYMAPEAIAGGRDLDARSDLWAVGVILHELLTARPLFASKNEYQTLLKVQKGEIMPPSTFNQACPPELDAITFKALARNPDDRFSSAGEMRDTLLEVKKQYSLQTGYRDVAGWLDWAFSLEQTPGAFTNQPTTGVSDIDPVEKQVRAKTPRPSRNADEEEAVAMVWGTGEGEGPDTGPLLLDDVPDVSAPRRAGTTQDIPDPNPGHGARGVHADDNLLTLASPGHAAPPPPDVTPDPRVARGSNQMRSTSPTGSQPKPRPARPTGTINVPKPAGTGAPTRTTAQGIPAQRTPAQPAPPARTSDRHPAQQARPTTPPQPVRTTTLPPQPAQRPPGARQTGPSPTVPPSTRQTGPSPTVPPSTRQTGPARAVTEPPPEGFALPSIDTPALRAEDLFGDDLADSAATPPTPPRKATEFDVTTNPVAAPLPDDGLPSVPVVRFTKQPTSSPPVDGSRTTGPLRAATAPPDAPALPRTTTGQLRTPTLSPPDPTRTTGSLRTKSPSQATVIKRSSKRAYLFAAIGVVVAGGAAAAIMLISNQPAAESAHVTAPSTGPVAPTITTGTVKVVTEPADAVITIEGMPAHTGSPWTVDLPAGIHQIEIHHAGLKAWLTSVELSQGETQTLRVVLEPLGAATPSTDATLTISTNPPGLEALLDGKPLAEPTPTKASIKVGPHTITVRQNGAEVWHQSFTAEASSDYEFNPSFTAAKQRERAERSTTPPPARAKPQTSEPPKAEPEPSKAEPVKSEPLEPPKAELPTGSAASASSSSSAPSPSSGSAAPGASSGVAAPAPSGAPAHAAQAAAPAN